MTSVSTKTGLSWPSLCARLTACASSSMCQIGSVKMILVAFESVKPRAANLAKRHHIRFTQIRQIGNAKLTLRSRRSTRKTELSLKAFAYAASFSCDRLLTNIRCGIPARSSASAR